MSIEDVNKIDIFTVTSEDISPPPGHYGHNRPFRLGYRC